MEKRLFHASDGSGSIELDCIWGEVSHLSNDSANQQDAPEEENRECTNR